MHRFEKLEVWKDAVEMVTGIYSITKCFPNDEIFGLTTQMRRCAVSIPANIAEGSCRNNPKEFKHFLGISAGSTAELITHLHIAIKLNLLEEEKTQEIFRNSITVLKQETSLYSENLK
ncbi:MAG: four helix bundle protein [Flavobacteriales bacterium]|nr:four helix bundle protein [Flavobacteriales bacterium]